MVAVAANLKECGQKPNLKVMLPNALAGTEENYEKPQGM
jgi:hypothetical protein